MIEYLESLKGPSGRDQYIDINPKYFFNKRTWETVLKLKQIFLDFDEDGNNNKGMDYAMMAALIELKERREREG